MGRLNLTAIRVRQRAILNLENRTGPRQAPVWLNIPQDIPPAQILIRQQPQPQALTQTRVRTQTLSSGARRLSLQQTSHTAQKGSKRLFCPSQIQHEEDALRQRFYRDHPWELARPRTVTEGSGNQHAHTNYATGLQQPGMPLNGESVVQRQLYLLHTSPDITENQAYDIARKEFYALRRKEEIATRVMREEALHNGIPGEKSAIQRSLDREDAVYDGWEKWARDQVGLAMQRDAGFAGVQLPQEIEAMQSVTDGEQGKGTGRISDTVFGREEQRSGSRAAREGFAV